MLQSLKDLNDTAQTEKYIIPGIYCGRVRDDWIAVQNSLIKALFKTIVEIFVRHGSNEFDIRILRNSN